MDIYTPEKALKSTSDYRLYYPNGSVPITDCGDVLLNYDNELKK